MPSVKPPDGRSPAAHVRAAVRAAQAKVAPPDRPPRAAHVQAAIRAAQGQASASHAAQAKPAAHGAAHVQAAVRAAQAKVAVPPAAAHVQAVVRAAQVKLAAPFHDRGVRAAPVVGQARPAAPATALQRAAWDFDITGDAGGPGGSAWGSAAPDSVAAFLARARALSESDDDEEEEKEVKEVKGSAGSSSISSASVPAAAVKKSLKKDKVRERKAARAAAKAQAGPPSKDADDDKAVARGKKVGGLVSTVYRWNGERWTEPGAAEKKEKDRKRSMLGSHAERIAYCEHKTEGALAICFVQNAAPCIGGEEKCTEGFLDVSNSVVVIFKITDDSSGYCSSHGMTAPGVIYMVGGKLHYKKPDAKLPDPPK